MPPLNLDENSATYQIRAYLPGTIQVNDRTLHTSIIITPTLLIEDWAPQTVEELSSDSFKPFLELAPTILLIGTGSQHVFLPAELYGELINQGIGVEVMSTSAASRTYNALSSEDRNVAAALVIR